VKTAAELNNEEFVSIFRPARIHCYFVASASARHASLGTMQSSVAESTAALIATTQAIDCRSIVEHCRIKTAIHPKSFLATLASHFLFAVVVGTTENRLISTDSSRFIEVYHLVASNFALQATRLTSRRHHGSGRLSTRKSTLRASCTAISPTTTKHHPIIDKSHCW
jgi:hypothetical protein